jgi:ribosomal protein L32
MTKKNSIALRRAADYDLKKSKEVVGPLVPVLRDKNGRLIDGLHRLHMDKNWPTMTIHTQGVDSDIARIVVNVQRRQVLPKEKTEMLRDLAGNTGWGPEQIAEKTGLSVSWVRKYLPSKYKNKQMAKIAKEKHSKRRRQQRPANKCPDCGGTTIPVFVCSECGYMIERRKELRK